MQIWQQLYQAYKDKDCKKYNELWNQLTEKDKKSEYF
jgi:hypothetical protein